MCDSRESVAQTDLRVHNLGLKLQSWWKRIESGERENEEEMKGVGSSYTLPPKRRWRGPVIAVLGLVLLSMLVPLVFLLGLHNGFHSATGINLSRLPDIFFV